MNRDIIIDTHCFLLHRYYYQDAAASTDGTGGLTPPSLQGVHVYGRNRQLKLHLVLNVTKNAE